MFLKVSGPGDVGLSMFFEVSCHGDVSLPLFFVVSGSCDVGLPLFLKVSSPGDVSSARAFDLVGMARNLRDWGWGVEALGCFRGSEAILGQAILVLLFSVYISRGKYL